MCVRLAEQLRRARGFGTLPAVCRAIEIHHEGILRMSIKLADRLQIEDEVLSTRMDRETVILNLKTGMYHGLDAVGTRFFELVKSNGELAEVHRQLLMEFDVAPERLEADLLSLSEDMIAKGILMVANP